MQPSERESQGKRKQLGTTAKTDRAVDFNEREKQGIAKCAQPDRPAECCHRLYSLYLSFIPVYTIYLALSALLLRFLLINMDVKNAVDALGIHGMRGKFQELGEKIYELRERPIVSNLIPG